MKNKKIKTKISNNAKEIYNKLKEGKSKKERMLYEAIEQKLSIIKEHPEYGNNLKKELFPKKYLKIYNIKNLFSVELPLFWRMIYTILRNERNKNEKIILILDIIEHKKYDKLFGYRKK